MKTKTSMAGAGVFGMLLAGAVLFFWAGQSGVRSQPGDPLPDVMKQKLLHAQKLLEGMAQGDYALIEKEGRALKSLSAAAGWQRARSETYDQWTRDFQRHSDAIVAAAKVRNLDGAALAYFQMTLSCIHCHRHLRGSDVAALDLEALTRLASDR